MSLNKVRLLDVHAALQLLEPGRLVVNESYNLSIQYQRMPGLDSELFKRQLEVQLSGMQPNFGPMHLKKVLVPLPPLAEQKRIVAKVDELMRWCDALEARLTAARTAATYLLDATLHQMLRGNRFGK